MNQGTGTWFTPKGWITYLSPDLHVSWFVFNIARFNYFSAANVRLVFRL